MTEKESSRIPPGLMNCTNCDAVLQGAWCHECGQPVKGMIRHFHSIFGDFLDTVIGYDNRIWRTLIPLYFQPGRMTNDFIAGKRMRFVLPFRLFFILSLLAFLALQITALPTGVQSFQTDTSEQTGSDAPAVPTELESILEELDIPEGDTDSEPVEVVFFGGPWDRDDNPLAFGWLPSAANAQLNAWIEQAIRNVERVGDNPRQLVEDMLGLLSIVLFIMMPIFALLLKIMYVFKRRLYMEHLLVALHSHSFLFLAVLVSTGLLALQRIFQDVIVIGLIVNILVQIVPLWIPVYLLLMQKRVYAQGWPMTVWKYCVLGVLYSIMVSFALVLAALVSLINL